MILNMKKILIVINNFCTGGIQKSLIELLPLICDKYDITLYASRFYGPYTEQIPSNVKILKPSRFAQMVEYPRWEYRKVGGIVNLLLKLVLGFLTSQIGRRIPARIYCFFMGNLPGKYDVAISYGHSLGNYSFHNLENEITLYCTRATRKATFVHCDYEQYGGNIPYNHFLYTKFDRIAAVSQSVAKKFCDILQDQKDKVSVVYNACNYTFIRQQAAINPVEYDRTSIVSVCRLSPVKGLLRCMPILKQLKNEGYDFEWHIVGGGDDAFAEKMTDVIKSGELERIVIMEGEQANPYRYMKNADFLFLPSLHEAAPMVFNEAACLGLTVLSTNTLSANELVANRGLGEVCENSGNPIYSLLKRALDKKIRRAGQVNMDVWNNRVVEQFSSIISL